MEADETHSESSAIELLSPAKCHRKSEMDEFKNPISLLPNVEFSDIFVYCEWNCVRILRYKSDSSVLPRPL